MKSHRNWLDIAERTQSLSCVILFLLVPLNGHAQPPCDIVGNWHIELGIPTGNYWENPYSENRIYFTHDSVELASGFFYNTLKWDEDYPEGRYPFVYYGQKEAYKISGDSLCLYSNPYNSWKAYRIFCSEPNAIELIGKRDTVMLSRLEAQIDYTCKIRYITAEVDDGPLSLFNNHYRVTFTENDVLIYEGPNFEVTKFIIPIVLKLGLLKRFARVFAS